MDQMAFLASVEVCQGLDAGQMAQVAACCRVEHANQGQRIFKEGEKAEDLCFLVSGRVGLRFELPDKSTSEDMNILSIDPGHTFSWSALVPPRRYTLSSYCTADTCTYLRASEQALSELFEAQPRIGYVFMRNLNRVVGRRIRALQDELARLTGQDLIDGW